MDDAKTATTTNANPVAAASSKNVRHAEKRRTSTCRFADRVARISVDLYQSLISNTTTATAAGRPTCVATVVAHYDEKCGDGGRSGRLRVLSLGVGTKFLPEAILQADEKEEDDDAAQEEENPNNGGNHAATSLPYGRRVRDLHAEVLARRAFRRYVTLEILEDLRNSNNNNNPCNYTDSSSPLPSILVRSTTPMGGTKKIRYRLRPGVTLHLYTSSAPCGNATLKKFCKMSKERFREELGPDDWPKDEHVPFAGHSIKLGEFALLIKKDNSTNNTNCKNSSQASDHHASEKRSRKQEQILSPKKRNQKPWPANLSDDWTPPGTTIVGFHHNGSIHTCSDKILRWNCLGLQGSFLSSLLEDPLYISTLTVGRKLSGAVCRRAVCCRLRPLMCFPAGTTNDMGSSPPREPQHYRLHHPAVMGTEVYLDEMGVIQTNPDSHGQDVRFHSSLSWVWWDGQNHTQLLSCGSGGTLECIDGSTGFLAMNKGGHQSHDTASKMCSQELTKIFMEAHQMATLGNLDVGEESETQMEQSWPFKTLRELRQLKKSQAPNHEQFKELLMAQDRLLSQWRRRGKSM